MRIGIVLTNAVKNKKNTPPDRESGPESELGAKDPTPGYAPSSPNHSRTSLQRRRPALLRQTRPRPRNPSARLDWAQLHQRTFGTDVLRCRAVTT